MPEVDVGKLTSLSKSEAESSSEDATTAKLDVLTSEELNANIDYEDRPMTAKTLEGSDELYAKITHDDKIASLKTMSRASTAFSCSASVVEPEPESQAETPDVFWQHIDSKPGSRQSISRQSVPLKLSDVQPYMEAVEGVKVEVEQEEVQEIISRFEKFCEEDPDEEQRVNPGDRIFEELQGKWRELRGGMDVTDLRPEFRALLAPLNVRVDLGCNRATIPKMPQMPKVQEEPPLSAKELPVLTSEIAAQGSRTSPRKRLFAGQQNHETRVPCSPRTAGAVVSLPSLQHTGKVRPTLERTQKAQQQRENCVHQ